MFCVPSGCYNQTPWTVYLINSSNLFLTVHEALSLRLGYQYGRVLVKPCSALQMANFSLCLCMVKGLGISSEPLLWCWQFHSWGGASWPNQFPKAPPLIASSLPIRISTYWYGEHRPSDHRGAYWMISFHSLKDLAFSKNSGRLSIESHDQYWHSLEKVGHWNSVPIKKKEL